MRRLVVILAAAGVWGCRVSPIAANRVETAIAPTFANLVRVQVSWMGLQPVAVSELAATARCRKLSGSATSGAGDWECTLFWRGPNRQLLRDTYDLLVATDGCYTATIVGDSFGGPTLKTASGRDVRNLLYAFEGCFDTTRRVPAATVDPIASRH